MLTTSYGTRDELHPSDEAQLAAYRYDVFVKTLGWQLACEPGLERDRFDGPDTVYVIARDEAGFVCGCARLLPTTKPYLLAEILPEVLHGMPPPASRAVWELSRFATQPPNGEGGLSRDELRHRFCVVFAAVVRSAMARGALRLITFTALGVERILRVVGIHAHRVGPPVLVDGKPVVALWIELDCRTLAALDVEDAYRVADEGHGHAPSAAKHVEVVFGMDS